MGVIRSLKSFLPQMQLKQSEINKALMIGNEPVWISENKEEYINKAVIYNPDVYSIIRLITKSASGIPWILYEVKNDKSLRGYKSITRKTDSLGQALAFRKKALNEIESHQISEVLENPNPLQSQSEWIENTIGFRLSIGESFTHGASNSKGEIQELWPMPAHLIDIIPGNWMNPIAGYKLKYNETEKFTLEEVMHLKYWNPDYSGSGTHLHGLSPIKALARVVRVSNDTYTANAKLLQNMGAMGVLSVDGDDVADQESTEAIEQAYYRKYGGPEKMGKILVAGTKMKWSQMGMPIDDLGIIESKKYNLRDICNAYQVNSALLNDPDNKTYNNMKEARKALMTDAVLPELDAIKDGLNRFLIPAYEKRDNRKYYLDYDISAIPELQEDLEKLTAQFEKAWWITGDEKRVGMNYGETGLPEMQVPMIPMGLMPINQKPENENDLQKMLNELGVREYKN